MIHIKPPKMIDFSDLKSPSIGEVSHALDKNIEFTFLQPPNKNSKIDKGSENSGIDNCQSSNSIQKPDSTSESK